MRTHVHSFVKDVAVFVTHMLLNEGSGDVDDANLLLHPREIRNLEREVQKKISWQCHPREKNKNDN